jgi:putative ABC transport system permease protein
MMVLTAFLAAVLLTALLTISVDIGDKMAREMKSYGANILVEPAEQAVLPELFANGQGALPAGEAVLDEAELINIMSIFWRNNIIGFAPILSGEVESATGRIPVIGTWFNKSLPLADEPDFRTGQLSVSPFWQITGVLPDDEQPEVLAGVELARQKGWKPGDTITLAGRDITVAGILNSGAGEDYAVVAPLKPVQEWLDRQGKVQAVHVSALTVPENELSRRAGDDPDSLDAESYDLWYCTAFVSTISHQLEEAVSGAVARPVWQIAASEGVIITKLQWLLLLATFAALLAAAMGMASLASGSVMERAGEIGLMKALGAGNTEVELLFHAEALPAALAGGALGSAAGWGLAQIISWRLFGAPAGFNWIVIPVIALLSLVVAALGVHLASGRISRLSPAEVLHGR